MNIFETLQDDLLDVECESGNPVFTWNGQDYFCLPSPINDQAKSSDIGFNENADFKMTVRMNQFATDVYPQLEDTIIYLSNSMLVKTISKGIGNNVWEFTCEIPRQ